MDHSGAKLDDVKQAFASMTFTAGLKESKKLEYRGYIGQLEEKALKAKAALIKVNPSFDAIPLDAFLNVCLDESVVSRTEFSVSCASNKALAYVGDSYLQLYISHSCFKKAYSPKKFQELCNVTVNSGNLATHYDALFEQDVVFQWTGNGTATASSRQKSELVVSTYLFNGDFG